MGNLHGLKTVIIQSQYCVWLSLEIKDEDKAKWSATRSGYYSCAATSNELGAEADKVEWWRMLLFKFAIPCLPLQVGWK